jgi:dGTPase
MRAGGAAAETDLPRAAVEVLGRSPSERIGRMVTDVVTETLAGGYCELRMSAEVLEATLLLRSFLFEAVYENETSTAEFRKAAGHPGRLWERCASSPSEFLDPAPSSRRASTPPAATSWPA